MTTDSDSDTAAALAAELEQEGYSGLFLRGDASRASAVWSGGAHANALRAIVVGEGYADLARVLAAEVLFAHEAEFPPAEMRGVLGAVYAAALRLAGTGRLTGELWGFFGEGPDGPLTEHLLDAGRAAVPGLEALRGDDRPIFYQGSEEATLGNALGLRVGDAASYLVRRLTDDG